MKPSLFLIPLAAAALSGCVTYKTRSDGITRTRLDETVRVDGIRVTPLRIVSDSRCPAKVQCVWAGELRVLTRIETGKGAQTRELVLGRSEPVADGTLTMVEANPEKVADHTIYPEEYRLGFRFQGGL